MYRADTSKYVPCTKHYFGPTHFVVTSCVLLEVLQTTGLVDMLARLCLAVLRICGVDCAPSSLVLSYGESIPITV